VDGRHTTLPVLIAAQAARTPDAVAVRDDERSLTFRELSAAADRLAGDLRRRGVGPEHLVGVCMRRSVHLVTALLAVWKAGGAFVPLDPDHPVSWRAGIAAEAGIRIVLTSTDGVPGASAVARTVLAADATYPAAAPADTPVDPESAAYVIFTSGSTGTPKGVVVPHRAIANRVCWTVREHGLGPGDVVLQKTVLTFDASVWEFFAPLISGATVALAVPGAEYDPSTLVADAIRHRATVLQTVPSVLRMLVREPRWPELTDLRLLFSAGEALHAELCTDARTGLTTQIWNTYGPTECAIDVAATLTDPAQTIGPVPIGRPIDGVGLQVVDAEGDLTPFGVTGELLATGVGLGRGYLNRPDLTAEKFVPDPYGEPGSRRYRTGDLVRWGTDEALHYLGRMDAQLKVNGIRIEPAGIEAALRRHPSVTEAVVGVPEGGTALVGYVVATRDLAADELRAFLARRLPAGTIPAVFVRLDALPQTSSGKVDRRRLPAPPAPTAVSRPAETPDEVTVAGIWADLLGHDSVSADDDFFARGGSSLQVTRLAARLRAATGRAVAVADLFTHSTVAAQAELIATVTETAEPLPVLQISGARPLSCGQERLWVLDQLRPNSPEWLAPMFLRLPGDIAVDVVRQALSALVERHGALRTRYTVVEGEPRQVVDPPAPVVLQRYGSADELVAALLATTFDLTTSSVVAAGHADLPDGDQLLVLAIHHIACDGLSTVILENDLRELCAARHEQRPHRLAPVTVQYPDFAAWQRQALTPQIRAREIEHWRTVLDGVQPIELRTDRPRPAVRDPRGAAVAFSVPGDLADAVIAVGRRHGVSPFTTLLTAYAVLLRRYSGQTDLTVGSPVSGRDHPDVSGTVGFFLNVLVMRFDLAGEPEFGAALQRVGRVVRTAFTHQRVPFEELVKELAPDRDPSREPFYQVSFDFHEDGGSGTAVNAGDLERFTAAWRIAKTDLTMITHRGADGTLDGVIEYATSIFDASTVEAMAAHFVRLLRSIVDNPDERLHRLRLADDPVPVAVSAPPTVRSPLHCFAEQVARDPAPVAVAYGDDRLSRGQLHARAGVIAAHLAAQGVGPGSFVGVCLGRGLDLVPTLLGVLRTGAAYVPLDPAQPAERLAFIAADAGVTTVVADAAHCDLVAGVHDGVTLLVEDLHDTGTAAPDIAISPDDLCYVIYTSGSTGRPKGVAVTHGQVMRLFEATDGDFGFGPADVWTLFHSYAFDFSVWEIWGALIYGGRLEVVPAEVVAAPGDVLDLLVRCGVTVLNQTPSAFLGLVDLAGRGDPRVDRLALRAVVFGGERLDLAELGPWVDRVGLDRPHLINMYGITEITVHATLHRLTAADVARPAASPIGRALSDLRIDLLDEWGDPTPDGLGGEIHVGGPGVAHGYLGRSSLTAERFVPDPYGAPGSRLYRSGDLARRLPDGTLDFLGRIDDQVKIRGYRIELGEITAVLKDHPALREVVVLVEQSAGDRRLVAYCVPEDPAAVPDAAELTRYAGTHLPRYMVPAAFCLVERIPLTANGKTDKRALAATAGQLLSHGAAADTPVTVVQERIAEIWEELLQARHGIYDSFFAVGGHSLLAVRLAARIEEEFDVPLSFKDMFAGPTIAAMAAAVEATIRAEIDALDDADLLKLAEETWSTPRSAHAASDIDQ
jgi:amino acid adenylation domain-containing protein